MSPNSFNNIGGGNININFNFGGGANSIGGGNLIEELLSDISQLLGGGNANSALYGDNFVGGNTNDVDDSSAYNAPAQVETPAIEESSQPVGSLKTDGNTITTAGGYKIEQTGQFNWKITGPDGKETKIEGDPHVLEGDGGKFDFKENSTFALPDGTKINVTTSPYGNNEKVTSQLEVISGNDRVVVSDIDKGLGKVGTVTQDGFAHSNSFLTEAGKSADVFVMGQETDDWSIDGKEIIGNDGNSSTFKTGGELHPLDLNKSTTTANTPPWAGETNTNRSNADLLKNWMNEGRQLFSNMFSNFNNSSVNTNRYGSNPYTGTRSAPWENNGNSYNRANHQQNLTHSFRQMSKMFNVLARLSSLSDHINTARNRSQMA